jgi:phage/plasmid-like protein (TIGR03299 family)
MAHDINFNELTGRHSFFSVRQKAWHGLGQIVEDYPTSAEALIHAGLNFEVEKRKMVLASTGNYTPYTTGIVTPQIYVPNHYATVRTDTQQVLGVVGSDYEIVQNIEAFNFCDAIVDHRGGIRYETAGALGKGERVFVTVKLPDYIRVGNTDDVIELFLFVTTSHDGTVSITVAFTPVRIVCANTLNAAMHNNTMAIRIRHTAKASERLEQAHKVMKMSRAKSEELQDVFTAWSKVRITDAEVLKLIQLAMAPNKETLDLVNKGLFAETSTSFKNTCEEVLEYAMGSESQQLITTKGTVFGAYNAVTGFYQNVETYKTKEAKLKSLVYGGTGQQRAQKAFNLCDEFLHHGASALMLN